MLVSSVIKNLNGRLARRVYLSSLVGQLHLAPDAEVGDRAVETWVMRFAEIDRSRLSEVEWATTCPPAGFVTSTIRRPCKMPWICPFCYARRVVSLFRRVRRMADQLRESGMPRKLLFFRQRRTLAAGDKAGWSKLEMKRRGQLRHSIGARSGLVVSHLAPYRGKVIILRSGVFVVPANISTRKITRTLRGRTKWELLEVAPVRDLANAMAKYFRYPTSLVTGDLDLTVKSFVWTPDKFHASVYGGFRKHEKGKMRIPSPRRTGQSRKKKKSTPVIPEIGHVVRVTKHGREDYIGRVGKVVKITEGAFGPLIWIWTTDSGPPETIVSSIPLHAVSWC